MTERLIFDDGVRLTDAIKIRLPSGYRERIQAAADREGIVFAEFVRRAIAERLARSTAPGGTPAPAAQEEAEHHV